MIKVVIDGKEIVAKEKKTILEVAKENGVYIPTLCYHENLLPIGSCRLCIVEIEGFDRPQTSCNTYVTEGMRVVTNSERLFQMRREFLKFILMEHPLDCPQCDKAGECRLQDLVYEHGIEKTEYRVRVKKERLETYASPLIRKWPTRCVLCLRCYHACREISGREVLSINGGGLRSKIEVVKKDDCISCGECLNVCPVGALTENISPKKTRPWMADQNIISTCPHCGFGCSLILVSENGYVAKVKTDEKKEPNYGSLCVRGRFGYDFANSELKIDKAIRRIYDEKREISLEDAQRELITKLKAIDEEGGAVGFLLSSRLTNEEASLVVELGKLLKRTYFSSPSYFFPYKVLKFYRLAGMPYGYSYDDIGMCDLILVGGTDLINNNHLIGVKVREAVKKRGAKIVTFDQYDCSLSNIAHLSFTVRPGNESLLLDAIALEIIKEDRGNRNLRNFEEYKNYLFASCGGQGPDACGVSESEIKDLMTLIKRSARIGIVFGPGIKEDSLESLINLSLLTGASLFPAVEEANGIGVSAVLKEMVDPKDLFTNKEIKGILVFEDEPSHYISSSILMEAYRNKYIVDFAFLPTEITKYAQIVFPFSGFQEKEGTYVSGCGKIGSLRRTKNAKIDSIWLLMELISKLGGTITENDITTGVTNYLREEKTEKAYVIPDKRGKSKSEGFLAIFRDLFRNPYLRYSKGINLVDSDKVYISEKDARILGVGEGDEVRIWNGKGSVTRRISIQRNLAQGMVLFKPAHDFGFVDLFEDIDRPAEVNLEKI